MRGSRPSDLVYRFLGHPVGQPLARSPNQGPQPRTLLQSVDDPYANDVTVSDCREVSFDHLKRIARRESHKTRVAHGVNQAEKTGRVRYRRVKLARSPDNTKPALVKGAQADPHFAYVDLMHLVARVRLPAPETGIVVSRV